jgi:hypothetical protein
MAALDDQHDWLLVLSSPGSLRIQLSDLAADLDLYVRASGDDSCHSSRMAGSADDVVELGGAAAGEYRITVRPYMQGTGGSYSVTASVQP